MSEICEVCNREYVKKSDGENINKCCSDSCRGKWYRRKSDIKDIDNSNYDKFTVKRIKSLGFNIVVTKNTLGVSSK